MARSTIPNAVFGANFKTLLDPSRTFNFKTLGYNLEGCNFEQN